MSQVTPIDDRAIDRLHEMLQFRASDKSRAFWRKYMLGNAQFRGVPMAGVREAVHAWWRAEALHLAPARAQKATALQLFDGAYTEDRLAGVLALSEILLPRLSARDLASFARLFKRGQIADWNLCDWFAIKVPGKMLEVVDDPAALARSIAAWRKAGPLWQRRAACVSFVYHARHGETHIAGLPDIIISACEALVRDPERFAQTGTGWVLRELSQYDRALVVDFIERHLGDMSREGLRYSTAKMPAADKRRLLKLLAG